MVRGGLTGIEAASEIAEAFSGLRVLLVSHGDVAAGFSRAGRAHVVGTLSLHFNVGLHERVAARAVRMDALETDRGEIPFDLCVWSAGFSLPALPAEAGLRTNAKGQVLVDPALRSVSYPCVYAVGDIAAPVLPPGQDLPMGCKSAMPMGALAGDNLARELAGEPAKAFDYALMFYCVSLGRRDGLIQWADDAGALTGRVLTGRRAALFKEQICRSTWWGLWLESKGCRAVVWKQTGHAPQQLPAPRQAQA